MNRETYYASTSPRLAAFQSLHPDVYDKIDEAFEKVRFGDMLISPAMKEDINTDLYMAGIRELPDDLESRVKKPLRVGGHMISMNLVPKYIGHKTHLSLEDWFDIQAMLQRRLLPFATPSALDPQHNVDISLEQECHTQARGTITRYGNLSILGGKTEAEMRVATGYCILWIRNALRLYHRVETVDVEIQGFCIRNYMVTGKMDSKINVYDAYHYISRLGMDASYMPEHANLLTIKPFPTAIPSAHVRVYPTGGIVVLGCTTLSEIDLCVQVVLPIIRLYLGEVESLLKEGVGGKKKVKVPKVRFEECSEEEEEEEEVASFLSADTLEPVKSKTEKRTRDETDPLLSDGSRGGRRRKRRGGGRHAVSTSAS